MDAAVGWLVTTPDLKWDGMPVHPGLNRRFGYGRFAMLGTGVPALTLPKQSRVFRVVFYGVCTSPSEFRDYGCGRAPALYFDEGAEVTDPELSITDPELLSWKFGDGTSVGDWQKHESWDWAGKGTAPWGMAPTTVNDNVFRLMGFDPEV